MRLRVIVFVPGRFTAGTSAPPAHRRMGLSARI